MPFPMTHIRYFLRLIVMRFLPRRVPSFWPPLSGLEARSVLLYPYCIELSRSKNTYQNDKDLISEQ